MKAKHFSTQLLTIFISMIAIVSCDSCNDEFDTEPVTLYGKATYISPLYNGGKELVLKGQKIGVKELKTNEFHELTTDSLGRFSLQGFNLDSKIDLAVEAKFNDSDEYKVTYLGEQKSVTGNSLKDVSLKATIPIDDTANYKRTILLHVVDEDRNIIPNATVIIYTSGVIAKADTGFIGFESKVAKLKTNENGRCLLMQLPADILFVISNYKSDNSINLKSDVNMLKLDTITQKLNKFDIVVR